MNGFEDIEKKLQNVKRQTNPETDKQILENARAEFQRSRKVRQSVYYIGPIFKATAAVIILAVVIAAALYLFGSKSEKTQPIVKQQIHPEEQLLQSKQAEEIKAADIKSTDKLKSDLEKVAALIQAKDVNGLLALLEVAEPVAQMLGANYLSQIGGLETAKALETISARFFPDDPNNVFAMAALGILDRMVPEELPEKDLKTEPNKTETLAVDMNKPQIISITPPSGSQAAMMFELEIVFDRPMNPNEFEINEPDNKKDFPREAGAFYNYVEYDTLNNKFTIPVKLPDNWNGSIRLENFFSADGNKAGAVTVEYHTSQKQLSESLLSRVFDSADSAEFTELLKKIKQTHSELYSVYETIHTEMIYHNKTSTGKAVFKIQGDRQFYADVSEFMGGTFCIGSDGNDCWLYSVNVENNIPERLVVTPYEDINNRNIDICNPFGIKDSNASDVIKNYNLEYEGTGYFEGNVCNLIRSYKAQKKSMWTNNSISTWWFDAETFMLVQVFCDYGLDNTNLSHFTYQSINEPLDVSEFRHDLLTTIEPNLPEPRDENYDTRYINVTDGTANGRMNAGWGMKGKGGGRGGGLENLPANVKRTPRLP